MGLISRLCATISAFGFVNQWWSFMWYEGVTCMICRCDTYKTHTQREREKEKQGEGELLWVATTACSLVSQRFTIFFFCYFHPPTHRMLFDTPPTQTARPPSLSLPPPPFPPSCMPLASCFCSRDTCSHRLISCLMPHASCLLSHASLSLLMWTSHVSDACHISDACHVSDAWAYGPAVYEWVL